MSEKCPGGEGEIELTMYESKFGLRMDLSQPAGKVELYSARSARYQLSCEECEINRSFTIHGGADASDLARQRAIDACPKKLGAKND